MFKEKKMKEYIEYRLQFVERQINEAIKSGCDPNGKVIETSISQKVLLNEILRKFESMGV